MASKSEVVYIRSVVSGIHRTKVGGHRDVPLLLENDNTIPGIDPYCMIVRFPEIEQIPEHLHRAITYPKNPVNKRYEDQFVEDVAGMKVGNVPANLCRLLRDLKVDERVQKLQCVPVGTKPRPSTTPHTKAKFRKSPYAKGKDSRGGGLVLDCTYIIILKVPSDRLAVASEIRRFLEEVDGDEQVY